jgi:hypothetical protein
MSNYRFILPQGGVMHLEFRAAEQAAAHAAYLGARFFKL